MAEAILAQLKKPTKPTTQTLVSIQYKKPEAKKDIKIAATIVDKRPSSKSDAMKHRAELLAKLDKKLDVESDIPVKEIEKEEEDLKELETIQDQETSEKEASQQAIDEKIVDTTIKEATSKPLAEVSELSAKLLEKPTPGTKKKLVLRPSATKPKLKPEHTVITETTIDLESMKDKLPIKEPKVLIRAPAYYMNNREIFINFITNLLQPYREIIDRESEDYSCDSKKEGEFNLLTHQNIVRDYINIYSPYRGLLLYHGLGSGKTCSSIAIAEGLKTDKKIIIMMPASLETNYKEELKKCGDKLYKKNQYWQFINTNENPVLVEPMSYVLSLPIEYIKKKGGVWFVNIKEKPNYHELDAEQQKNLDNQLDEMISYKYKFIRYNGLRQQRLDLLVQQAKTEGVHNSNPFSNKVIIIDEAHNFVSRIVNKLKRKDRPLALQLYDYLRTAENSKIILLTGTPIINYPNEIGITMNILRGTINTWTFKVRVNTEKKLTEEGLLSILNSDTQIANILDYFQYRSTSNTIEITRNPYGFISVRERGKYKGVELDKNGNIDDQTFLDLITEILERNKIIIIPESIGLKMNNCLPDTLDGFSSEFINPSQMKVQNMNKFKSRILGLVSYFPDIDALLPRYNRDKDFNIINIPMSDFQFSVYEEARVEERKIEKNNAKKRAQAAKKGSGNAGEVYEDAKSTYRIFSRAFCNFVFPRPDIKRPLPREGAELSAIITETAQEDLLDAISVEEKLEAAQEDGDQEQIDEIIQPVAVKESKSYEERTREAMRLLEENKDIYLTPKALETYSPKFLNILDKLSDDKYEGLHLIYSQFRTLEGIGILSLVLKANGFAQFKIKKQGAEWKLDIPVEDRGKPKFVLYTGTENKEEKEIARNIFNSNWNLVPESLRVELEKIASNNLMGEIIKIFMITASGAEGISLSNVRYVHLTEPYWHPVRIEQVIGRARRICSHKNLPKELQTVEVFLYLMIFSEKQLALPPAGEVDLAIELRVHDKSKRDPTKVLTSDWALYEIASIKENINRSILTNIKEAAIDCSIHQKVGSKEKLKCFTFGSVNPDKFSYPPLISDQEKDTTTSTWKTEVKTKFAKVTIKGKSYAYNVGKVVKENEDEDGIILTEVYTLDSVKNKNPIHIGFLEFKNLKPTSKGLIPL